MVTRIQLGLFLSAIGFFIAGHRLLADEPRHALQATSAFERVEPSIDEDTSGLGKQLLLPLSSSPDERQQKLLIVSPATEDGAPRGVPPVNDECVDAIVVTDGAHPYSTVGATTTGPVDSLCDFGFVDGGEVNSDVWFKYVAPYQGRATISLCGSAYDTKLAVYERGCPVVDHEAMACDEDACDPGFQSVVTVSLTSGENYYIRVGGFNGEQGGGTLTITSNEAPANDDCANAIELPCEASVTVDNSFATTSSDDPPFGCFTNGARRGAGTLWFKFVSPHGSVQINTCDSTGASDTLVALYDGETGCPLTRLQEMGCGEDECGPNGRLSTICIGSIVPGRTYYVQVATFDDASRGEIELELACPCPVGPDVIVGGLFGSGTNPNSPAWNVVKNWGRIPTGISGYSVGTISCNPGDVPVLWNATNDKHPVIGQQLYRHKDGRIEQIGMSWVKHGFLALDEDFCNLGCQTPDPFDGATLGVGCSDPYNNDLNGTTTRLGPRGHINAFTGAYPYPITSQNVSFPPPGPPATVGRRLQVKDADLIPSQNQNARYFIEGHYITSDDATLGNGLNNASYREVIVSNPVGVVYNLTLTGANIVGEAGIQAWKMIDPDVQETIIDVPAEGRFVLAARATDIGGGLWHYEYALYNYNSDRSGRAFTVPVPEGVAITNVGFHDVDYHSGDSLGTVPGAIENTDWTASVNPGSVRWETSTFASNPRANALRWATMYNYRFDANTPPTTGDVTIDLFKPGSPASVSGTTIVPDTANVVAPVDMYLSPAAQMRVQGQIVEFQLKIRSSASAGVEVTALDAILDWDPAHLQYVEYDVASAEYPWFIEGFLPNSDGLNDSLVDGDSQFSVMSSPGVPAVAPAGPDELIVATFRFLALSSTPGTTVSFMPAFGTFSETRVLGADSNTDLTGDISQFANVVIVSACGPDVGDVNGDQAYTFADIDAAVSVYLGDDTDPDHIIAADANCAGLADGQDIQPLVDFMLAALQP